MKHDLLNLSAVTKGFSCSCCMSDIDGLGLRSQLLTPGLQWTAWPPSPTLLVAMAEEKKQL